ncbi:MAG: thioredoxin [Bacteroidales bacterium]|nr:thioredoxin [Bacteroidales bacterium]
MKIKLDFKKMNLRFRKLNSRKESALSSFCKGFVFLSLILVLTSCGGNADTQLQKHNADMEIVHLNKSGFEKLINTEDLLQGKLTYMGDKPILIDFYATWCGPCRALSPILEDLAKEYKDRIVVYKVDVDVERDLAAMLSIRSIPTLLFVSANGEMRVVQGGMSKIELKKIIDEFLLR